MTSPYSVECVKGCGATFDTQGPPTETQLGWVCPDCNGDEVDCDYCDCRVLESEACDRAGLVWCKDCWADHERELQMHLDSAS